MPFPTLPEHSPCGDEVIAQPQAIAIRFHLPILTETAMTKITRQDGIVTVVAADGRRMNARSLIVANESFHRSYLPMFRGRGHVRGRVLHAQDYRTCPATAAPRLDDVVAKVARLIAPRSTHISTHG